MRLQHTTAPIGITTSEARYTLRDEGRSADLKDRHLRVWRQLVIGGTNREIARRMYLSPHTVHHYLSDLYLILDLLPERGRRRSRLHATLLGIEMMHHHPEIFREGEGYDSSLHRAVRGVDDLPAAQFTNP